VLEEALKEIEAKAGELPKDVKAVLATDIDLFTNTKGIAKSKIEGLSKSIKAAEQIAAAPTDINLAGKLLTETPNAAKFLSGKTQLDMKAGGFSWQVLGEYQGAKKELEALIKGTPTEAGVKKILIKYHGEGTTHIKLSAVDQAAIWKKTGKMIDIDALRSEIDTTLTSHFANAETHRDNIISLSEELATEAKEATPNATRIAELKKDLAEAKTELTKLTGDTEYGAKISSHLKSDEATFKQLNEFHKDIGSQIEKSAKSIGLGVTEAAEKGRGFWTKLLEFKRSEAYIAEQVANKGKTAEELGLKVGSFRWGKAIGAAAIITGAYLVGTGIFGKKSQTEMDRQNQPQIEAAPAR
jgi:hypothetical protein